jgi:NAD(P)-dependent dehydrogenase (short-subunit alcohol dehydrogenase family)
LGNHLQGKSAVVTGGGSIGIGGLVSSLLAAEGASVVVVDIARDSEGKSMAEKKVEAIKQAGGKAIASNDDICTMAGGEKIINTAISNFGKIDILVNVAGNFFLVPTLEMTEKQWDSIFAVHVKGTFSCIKAALPHMVQQKFGRIINFSSRAAFVVPPGAAATLYCNLAYNTAKAGIMGLTVALAGEHQANGITVNAILPSAVTPLFPGEKRMLADHIPVPENTGPEYVAPLIAYLATDEAKDVTGQFFYAAGGDICVYGRPLILPGPHTLIRRTTMWTIDDLNKVLPPLVK